MTYLKIWTSFRDALALLSDAEKGRIFMAMLNYAADETEPEFGGNEKFVWPSAKNDIDRTRRESERNAKNGKLGGRPEKDEQKPTETEENRQKPTETDGNLEEPTESLKEKKGKEKKGKETEGKEMESSTPPHGGVQRGARFVPPTVEEVAEYCRERKNTIDAEEFVSYYEQAGWTVGKNKKMTDWRASVRYWESMRRKNSPEQQPSKWGIIGQMV